MRARASRFGVCDPRLMACLSATGPAKSSVTVARATLGAARISPTDGGTGSAISTWRNAW